MSKKSAGLGATATVLSSAGKYAINEGVSPVVDAAEDAFDAATELADDAAEYARRSRLPLVMLILVLLAGAWWWRKKSSPDYVTTSDAELRVNPVNAGR